MDADLIRYEARDSIAVITLNDPPANTYSYQMMQQLDRAILEARMDKGRAGDRDHRQWREVLLRGRQHSNAGRCHAGVQILFLFARQRDAEPARANAKTGD